MAIDIAGGGSRTLLIVFVYRQLLDPFIIVLGIQRFPPGARSNPLSGLRK